MYFFQCASHSQVTSCPSKCDTNTSHGTTTMMLNTAKLVIKRYCSAGVVGWTEKECNIHFFSIFGLAVMVTFVLCNLMGMTWAKLHINLGSRGLRSSLDISLTHLVLDWYPILIYTWYKLNGFQAEIYRWFIHLYSCGMFAVCGCSHNLNCNNNIFHIYIFIIREKEWKLYESEMMIYVYHSQINTSLD